LFDVSKANIVRFFVFGAKKKIGVWTFL